MLILNVKCRHQTNLILFFSICFFYIIAPNLLIHNILEDIITMLIYIKALSWYIYNC